MKFKTLTTRQADLSNRALAFCRGRFGTTGWKGESEIASDIGWRPTFFLRSATSIIACEYNDSLFPSTLAFAIVDAKASRVPIKVFQVSPLSVYLADKNQTITKKLQSQGIGLITVDENTNQAAIQFHAVSLAQHISEQELSVSMESVPKAWRHYFRAALDTYVANQAQGLQQASQIVEALVRSFHAEACKKGWVPARRPNIAAATLVDDLYASANCQNHRNAFGGARHYLKTYRNVSSHAVTTARQALMRTQKCRSGFLESAQIAGEFASAARAYKLTLRLHT